MNIPERCRSFVTTDANSNPERTIPIRVTNAYDRTGLGVSLPDAARLVFIAILRFMELSRSPIQFLVPQLH